MKVISSATKLVAQTTGELDAQLARRLEASVEARVRRQAVLEDRVEVLGQEPPRVQPPAPCPDHLSLPVAQQEPGEVGAAAAAGMRGVDQRLRLDDQERVAGEVLDRHELGRDEPAGLGAQRGDDLGRWSTATRGVLGQRDRPAQPGHQLLLEGLADLERYVGVIADAVVLDRTGHPQGEEDAEPGEEQRGERNGEPDEGGGAAAQVEAEARTQHALESLVATPRPGNAKGRPAPRASRPPASAGDAQLLTLDAVVMPAWAWIFATTAGSLEVTSVRHPPSMLTNSRVSLPLAAAPRISLQKGHR